MHQRSRFLVDPKVQWAVALRVIGHWTMFLVCLVAIGVMVRVLLGAGTQSMSESLRTGMMTQLPILGVMILLLPIFIRDTLKLSNRFAGPMYRLRTELRNLATDQPGRPITFRTGDFWQEAAGDFNHVLGQLERLQQENDELQTALNQKSAGSPPEVMADTSFSI